MDSVRESSCLFAKLLFLQFLIGSLSNTFHIQKLIADVLHHYFFQQYIM